MNSHVSVITARMLSAEAREQPHRRQPARADVAQIRWDMVALVELCALHMVRETDMCNEVSKPQYGLMS
jgi:hypothetical protein